ncbi:ATP-binding cassette domain-containing protein, partial [Streptomyces nigra]
MCAVRGLTKTYPAVRGRRGTPGTPALRATDDVRLDIAQGEIFGLLGPNGAGKTTLVRQLTGLMRPDSGSVEILGHDIVRHPERAARILAYLGQESTALDELTISLAAETTGRLRGLDARTARAERDDVLDELGLTPIAGRPLRKLSGGQRRLACFAAALVGERPLLVLDEPTTGMDPVARRAVWSAVDRRRAERGTTVLLVVTDLDGFLADVAAREAQMPTGLDGGIGIPHCRSAHVTEPTLAFGRSTNGIDFGAPDGPADLIFLIAAPAGADDAHLTILSSLARQLMDSTFTDALRAAGDAESASALIRGEQTPVEGGDAEGSAADAPRPFRIVAVTSCPTGIAHTYMAAESLENAGRDAGVDLVVETQGSAGFT